MRPESLTLLEDPEVRSLVASWPAFEKTGDVMADVRTWSRAAGVDPQKTWRKYHVLMMNQIIYPDGSIDNIAKEYVVGMAMAWTKRKKKDGK